MPDQAEMRKSHEKQNMETDEEKHRGVMRWEETDGRDFLPGQVPFIDQSVFWKDRE